MESFFSRYRNALVLIVVLVAQLLALAVQAKRPAADGADQRSVSLFRHVVIAVITPPERLLHGTGMWFRSLWFGYVDLIHVRRDNTGLQQEIERLRLEQASIAQDAEQGRRLQKMLGFSEHYIYKTQPAQVIGTSGTDQSQVLYIDKGSDEGLAQDMPVITSDGIVGKLKDVFPHTSQVLLVSDPTSGVGVIVESTRTRGILKGRAFGQLQVVDISPDSRIKPGDKIITSGGDQIFPRGLPVGTVDRVLADPEHDPLVDVIVHPAAGLSQLEEVLVITSLSDATSPQEAKDIAESEAESEAEQKKASDILSERLPSRVDTNEPADTNPEQVVDAAGNAVQTADHPRPIHPDQFSPNAEPDAAQMVPGRRWAQVKDGTEELPPHQKPLQTPSTLAPGAEMPTGAAQAKEPTAGGGIVPRTAAPGTASTATTPSHPSPASPAPLKPQSGTRVIVDGPEPLHPAAHTNTGTGTHAIPPRKSPQLVPNDGSRPPKSEPVKKPDAPETQQPPPSTSPPGGAH